MSLIEYQSRLKNHFDELAQTKRNLQIPIYALEHNLDRDERTDLLWLLNSDLESRQQLTSSHWLAWIVAATEVGYGYDGNEYWDSFAASIPQWNNFGNRNQVRAWFQHFQKLYGAIRPTGNWARHFPIIAWPITNAIIPLYLQRHFADHLYEIRHRLGRLEDLSLEEIGEYVASTYTGHSSRFENFLQQKLLTSRLILALREEIQTANSPISSQTFSRIVEDFEVHQRTKQRLSHARSALRKVNLQNNVVAKERGTHPQKSSSAEASQQLCARLIFRRNMAGVWKPYLSFPNVAAVLKSKGITPQDLSKTRSRFRVRGGVARWKPARALNSFVAGYEEELAELPEDGALALEFETDSKLETHCSVFVEHGGFPILFKRPRASTAHVVLGKHVRPNELYLVATNDEKISSFSRAFDGESVPSALKEITVTEFTVPTALTEEHVQLLTNVGLGYSLAVQVDAVGLTPRTSTQANGLIYSVSETPVFRIKSDIAVAEYRLQIAGEELRVPNQERSALFLSLPNLPVGHHQLRIQGLGVAGNTKLAAEFIDIEVSDVNPWQEEIHGKAGVSLHLDPLGSSVEDVIDKAAKIVVRAPPNRTAKLHLQYSSAAGDELLQKQLLVAKTPIASSLVAQKLAGAILGEGADAYQQSARIDLVAYLDELGAEKLVFDKEPQPLRWLSVSNDVVRLADDTDPDIKPEVSMFALDSVDVETPIDYETACNGLKLPGEGGLVFAKHKNAQHGVIVSIKQDRYHDFKDLSIHASVSELDLSVPVLLNAMKRWDRTARLIGPMAHIAKFRALEALKDRVEFLLCGPQWMAAKAKCSSPNHGLSSAYSDVYYSKGFASTLSRFNWDYTDEKERCDQEFIRLCSVYKLSNDEALVRLALKIAFTPEIVQRKDIPERAFKRFRRKPAIIKGAYYAKLVYDTHSSQIEVAA